MEWYLATIKTAKGVTETMETAENMGELIEMLRANRPGVSVAVRKLIGPEWDCNSWNISGHVPHTNN
jgi:hypothetical protein